MRKLIHLIVVFVAHVLLLLFSPAVTFFTARKDVNIVASFFYGLIGPGIIVESLLQELCEKFGFDLAARTNHWYYGTLLFNTVISGLYWSFMICVGIFLVGAL